MTLTRNQKPKKQKRMRKVDPVRVQVAVRTHLPPEIKVTKELIREAIQKWADTGDMPRGFELDLVEWQNPTRLKRKDRNWRKATTPEELEEARTSLHLGRLLRGRFVSFR